MTTTTNELRTAVISDCGRYRYVLGRRWTAGPTVAFICLNPSTADARTDDPTIRRIRGFAKAWGYSALVVANLYAWRATDPAELKRADDPVGPDNDSHLVRVAADCELVVAAWGVHARPERVAAVRALPGMDRLHVLGLTKGGAPRHPLYLPGGLVPKPWALKAGCGDD